MTYPDTTRSIYWGIQANPLVLPANMYHIRTMNEPAHTLQNGIIIVDENTGTRMHDNGEARGKRGSSLRIQADVHLDEVGLFYESAIGAGSTSGFSTTQVQDVTITGTPTGGTFTLTYAAQTTAAIAYNALAAAVKSALEALSNIAVGDVDVTGGPGPGTPWVVKFQGALIYNTVALTADGTLLTGGTSPAIAVTNHSITSAYLRTYLGGVIRGLPVAVQFFNGLYWREMKNVRINTMNVQGFGDQVATLDIEVVGPASYKIATPTPLTQDDTYPVVDVPMQSLRVGGTIDADMDRMAFNINNNLTPRNTMDGTTSMKRQRFGFFEVAFDGMADYPDYTGSYFEAMENNTPLGALDLVMLDDLHTVGSGVTVHPYMDMNIPQPLHGDTTEGSDGGELVQMLKGRAKYNNGAAAGLVVKLANGKAGTYYAAS